MKKKAENKMEEIIRNYGSLAAYNEEQRCCALVTIETAMQANPFIEQIWIENAMPLEAVETRPERRPLWLKFFGQKIKSAERG